MTEARSAALRLPNLLALLSLLLIAAGAASLMVGQHVYAPDLVWRALTAPAGETADIIIRELRVPRAILAPVVGASLAVAGALMQTVTRNEIASPGLLGVNSGAALAVVLAVGWFGIEAGLALAMVAAIGALLTAMLVFGVALAAGTGLSPTRMLLSGLTVSMFLASCVQMQLVSDEATLERLIYWLAGGFADRPLTALAGPAPMLIVGLLIAAGLSRPLDVLLADDETATALGGDLRLLRGLSLCAVALLAGGAVAAAGPIGFIGLMAPNGARRLVGLGHLRVLPVSALLGALLAMLADVAARFVVFPLEAPVGAVTALIGVPVMIVLLRRRAG